MKCQFEKKRGLFECFFGFRCFILDLTRVFSHLPRCSFFYLDYYFRVLVVLQKKLGVQVKTKDSQTTSSSGIKSPEQNMSSIWIASQVKQLVALFFLDLHTVNLYLQPPKAVLVSCSDNPGSMNLEGSPLRCQGIHHPENLDSTPVKGSKLTSSFQVKRAQTLQQRRLGNTAWSTKFQEKILEPRPRCLQCYFPLPPYTQVRAN